MGYDGLKNDLEKLISTYEKPTVQISIPEFSAINDYRLVDQILDHLVEKYPSSFLIRILLPNHTHAVSAGGNSHITGALSKPLYK